MLRIDSFSKTVGAGLQLAYVTADKAFVDKVQALNSLIMNHAATLSQVCGGGLGTFMKLFLTDSLTD